jgi:acyl-CoA synthetase (AMP-forming)/AMP-acid ligase II
MVPSSASGHSALVPPDGSAPICLCNSLHFATGSTDWAGLLAEATQNLGAPARYAGIRLIFVVANARAALASLVFGLIHGLDCGVIETSRLSPEVAARIAEAGVMLIDASCGAVLGQDGDLTLPAHDTDYVAGRITVLTSGTTGLLKLIAHSAATLNTFDRVKGLPANSWFLPYQVGSYAWYQMAALGLFMPDQDLVPGDFSDLAASFAAALHQGIVTAISSTPTFWRHALMSIDQDLLASAPLHRVSLGGEIVDQAILDRLAALYPQAQIRHIYASSEAGAAIVVTDGRAGFAESLLQHAEGRIGLKIKDGRLFIRSPYSNKAATGDWIDSGDLVENRAGRIYFCGRAGNSMINVGGQKAFPADIEAHLLSHPDVIWAQVTARRAPLVGYLPVASVVLRHKLKPDNAEAMLTAYCLNRLADYAVPRLWEFPDTVPIRASLKS